MEVENLSRKSINHTYWRAYPLTLSIMNIVERRDGEMLEDDLVRLLDDEIGDYSDRELNSALMKLEIEGLLQIREIKKNFRKISIIKEGQRFLAVGED